MGGQNDSRFPPIWEKIFPAPHHASLLESPPITFHVFNGKCDPAAKHPFATPADTALLEEIEFPKPKSLNSSVVSISGSLVSEQRS